MILLIFQDQNSGIPKCQGKIVLHKKIQNLYPEVNVTYFVPDYRKHGGFYETYIGRLERVDTKKKLLVFCNEKEIEFGLLCDLTVTEQENQNEGI